MFCVPFRWFKRLAGKKQRIEFISLMWCKVMTLEEKREKPFGKENDLTSLSLVQRLLPTLVIHTHLLMQRNAHANESEYIRKYIKSIFSNGYLSKSSGDFKT